MSPRRAALYLQIPAAYCRSFGGLRWAQRGEAVEFLDGPNAGRTFAFAAEIGHFLEGLLVPGSPCPAFGSALHLLYVIGLGDRGGTSDWPVDCFPARRLERIAAPFREQGRPLRNAGALCGWLYRLRRGSAGRRGPAPSSSTSSNCSTAGAGSRRWSSATRCSGRWIMRSNPRSTRKRSTPG